MTDFLTSFNRRSEDVRILSIIIAELELGDIERHIFPAHFVECAYHAALEDRPEAFDGLSVDCSDDILTSRMVNNSRVWVILVERIVAWILIGAKQAHSMRDSFADERSKRGGLYVRDNARNHIALAADSADDRRFAGTDTARSTAAAAFIPMQVLGQAADKSFIDFDNSAELINVLHERDADAVTHIPSRFQGAKSHIMPNLAGAYSLFASEHQMNNAIPVAERLISVFEDCPGNMRKAIALRCASITLPVPRLRRDGINLLSPATRTPDTIWPTLADKVSATSVFVGEHRLELGDAHLMDLRWLFCSRHNDLPFSGKTVARNYEPVKCGNIAENSSTDLSSIPRINLKVFLFKAFCGGRVGDSSTVEQRTLTPSILVRIQVPQPQTSLI